MGQKLFIVPSKCLLFYWVFCFDLVRKMWGLLATSNDPIAANENLSNKPYFCLALLSNLVDILRPFDARSIILGVFDPFYPFARWYPTGKVG